MHINGHRGTRFLAWWFIAFFTSNAFFPFVVSSLSFPCRRSKLSSTGRQIRVELQSNQAVVPFNKDWLRETSRARNGVVYWQAECVRAHSKEESTLSVVYRANINVLMKYRGETRLNKHGGPSKKCRHGGEEHSFLYERNDKEEWRRGAIPHPRGWVTRSYKGKTLNVSLISQKATPFPKKFQFSSHPSFLAAASLLRNEFTFTSRRRCDEKF